MEAMEERQVTSVGQRYLLPHPFFVLATQNPIDMEGTYPLPAAQLDRFMFRIRVEYPESDAEARVARRVSRGAAEPLNAVLSRDEILAFGDDLKNVEMPDALQQTVVNMVRATRPDDEGAPDFVREWIAFGAGPRAAQALSIGGRARALIYGRNKVTENDIAALAPDVIRHRLVLNYHATAEGVRAVDVVRRLLRQHFRREPTPQKQTIWQRLFS